MCERSGRDSARGAARGGIAGVAPGRSSVTRTVASSPLLAHPLPLPPTPSLVSPPSSVSLARVCWESSAPSVARVCICSTVSPAHIPCAPVSASSSARSLVHRGARACRKCIVVPPARSRARAFLLLATSCTVDTRGTCLFFGHSSFFVCV